MKRLLVTGVSGLLGWNICRTLPQEGWEVTGICLRNEVRLPGVDVLRRDLRGAQAIEELFEEVRPDALIHAAAISDAEYCQTQPSDSFGLNVDVPVRMASRCRERSIPFVFTSSDLVFDGLNPPYREKDPVSPISAYGMQKVQAERGIQSSYPDAVICRMPLMFGLSGSASRGILPLLETMKSGAPLRLFVNEHRTPLSARTAAGGVLLALRAARGILHLGGAERVSRFELVRLIAEVFGESGAVLVPCRQQEVITRAPRPPDLAMDSSRAFELGFRPPSLFDQVRELFSEVKHTRTNVEH